MKKFTILIAFLFLFMSFQPLADAATVVSVPVVGAVTPNSARFVVRTDVAATVKVMLSTDGSGFTNPVYTNETTTDSAKDFFVLVDVSGLSSNTTYYYQPVVDGQTVTSFTGKFKTFPPAGEAANFSFIFGSGQQRYLDDPNSNIGSMFPIMAQEDALFFLHQGDWVYPDTTDNESDPENYFSKHPDLIYKSYETRYDPNFPMADLLKAMAVDYTFDDHDEVNDNSDKSYMDKGAANSIRIYQEAFPHYPLESTTNGIWHKFSCGNVDIFMTDNRSQRDPNLNALTWTGDRYVFTANYLDNHTILGDEQMNWLLDQLKTSTAKWKFISTGTAFNPGTRGLIELALMLQGTSYDPITDPATGNAVTAEFLGREFSDKWAGFPASIYKLLSGIINNNIENVIMLSGDSHNSAIDDGKNSLIPELMAGGLDRTNSQIVAVAKKVFMLDIWDQGGHTYDNGNPPDLGNAYGKVEVFGADSVVLKVVSETQRVLAHYAVTPGYVPRRVASIVSPGGVDFGVVPQNGQGGNAFVVINTSIDTLKVTNITVTNPLKGQSQIVPLETKANLAPGEAKIFQFGFIPVGAVGDTTQAGIVVWSNDVKNVIKIIGAQGVIGPIDTDVAEKNHTARAYQLLQNYPNPFNPATTIAYSVPELGHVSLKVFDLLGREVATLVDDMKLAGNYKVNFDASKLPSGMYIYQLQTDNFTRIRKMVLLR